MTILSEALRFDAEDQPIEAADAYEAAISQEEDRVTSGTYLDLAVLYFVCNDGGYAAHHHLPQAFLERAWERMFQLPEQAEARFGQHSEFSFWRRFFAYFWLGGEQFQEECAVYVADGRTLVPYFYLYAFSSDPDECYRSEAMNLRRQVRSGRTAKDRYILTVLDAAFQHRGFSVPN
jgi:hypothetical protein